MFLRVKNKYFLVFTIIIAPVFEINNILVFEINNILVYKVDNDFTRL